MGNGYVRWYFCFLTLLFSSLLFASTEPKKLTRGWVEKVTLVPQQFTISAKLDTGAMSSSLGVRKLTFFQQNRKPWVRFYIDRDDVQDILFERPVVRYVKIKKRSGEVKAKQVEYFRRPVVEMRFCIGSKQYSINVNLADRYHFVYPLLLGRHDMRRLKIVVDPSLKFTTPPRCKISEKDDA